MSHPQQSDKFIETLKSEESYKTMSTAFGMTTSGRMRGNHNLKRSTAEILLQKKYDDTKNLRLGMDNNENGKKKSSRLRTRSTLVASNSDVGDSDSQRPSRNFLGATQDLNVGMSKEIVVNIDQRHMTKTSDHFL